MRVFLVAIATMGIVASAADIGLGQSTPATGQSIQGVWEAVSGVTTGANPSSNLKRLPSIYVYTKGYYALLAQDPGSGAGGTRPPRQAPPPLKTPGQPTDAEKIALYEFWAPATGIGGTYEVKGNMLTQHPVVSKGAVGAGNTFEFRLEDGGKTLIEIARSAPGQPVSETRRTFRRLE